MTVKDEGQDGFITVSPYTSNDGETYWTACYWDNRPTLRGFEVATEVLVETVSRAAESQESATAAALRKKPNAQLISEEN